MPFAKRVVEPQLLCRYHVPNTEGVLYDDFFCVNNLALSQSLRQLSDMAQHACSIFKELESELLSNSLRLQGLQSKLNRLQETCSRLDHSMELVPESSLDIESKLQSHYQRTYHHPKDVFQPSTRPACVDELYRQASLDFWVRQSDRQSRRSGSSGQVAIVPQLPKYLSNNRKKRRTSNLTKLESINTIFPTKCCSFSPWSKKDPDADTDGVVLGLCSKFPIPNTPSTLDKRTNWSKALPLPTPAERMKSNSQVIISSVIPINVTGLSFDREATLHCSVMNSKSLLQRRRTLKRKKLGDLQVFNSKEQTANVFTPPDFVPSNEELANHISSKDSCCQTEDFLISGTASLNLLGTRRVQAGDIHPSYSAGNISLLPYSPNAMFTASLGPRLRTNSLPLDASWVSDSWGGGVRKKLSPFHHKALSSAHEKWVQMEWEENTGEEAASENQNGRKYHPISDGLKRSWMKRPQLAFTADLDICELSYSSKTLSNPLYFIFSSAPSLLEGPLENKDDHHSNSGRSSSCASQTSAALTSQTCSCHDDSELSLVSPTHANDDSADPVLQQDQDLRNPDSFSSTVLDGLKKADIDKTVEHKWSNVNQERSTEVENVLACPSSTSIVTCKSSLSDRTPSEKEETVSHCSVDTEGYYTSMHFDCGIKGRKSYMYDGCSSPGRHNLFLRKSKMKPYPPKRISSLKNICILENTPNEKEAKHFLSVLSTKEEKPQLVSSSTTDSSSSESEAVSPLRDLSGSDDLLKICNTEDLFTIMHRSKRKVLGQWDFSKLPATNFPSLASGCLTITGNMSNVTQTLEPKMSSSVVNPRSLQEVPMPIKHLLLRKDSDPNYYCITAADILSRPVMHVSQKDEISQFPFVLQQPKKQTNSPQQQNISQIDFLPGENADGFFPNSSKVLYSPGQGCSRTLPSANRRYGAQGRPHFALMQVISEGEKESSDGSPHD